MNTYGIVKPPMEVATCASSRCCFPLNGTSANKKSWFEGKDLYLGDISGNQRVLVAVHWVLAEEPRPMMMDAITGTLYRLRDGSSLSSDLLVMKSYTKATGLPQRLMKTKGSNVSGVD